MNHQKMKKVGVARISKKKLGPPCAPCCTPKVDGAQCRSMVNNVALYYCGGGQCYFHKTK